MGGMGWGGGEPGNFLSKHMARYGGGGGDFLSAIYASESGMGF